MTKDWIRRHFSDSQIVILAGLLLTGLVVVLFVGEHLVPVIASAIVVYVLDGIIHRLRKIGILRMVAVIAVFSLFFLKDKGLILSRARRYLPQERGLAEKGWHGCSEGRFGSTWGS